MKQAWSWLLDHIHEERSRVHILRSLLEQRYRDISSLAFSRLVAGQTFFFDETVSRLRSHFSEDRVFCAFPLHFVEGLAEIGSQIFHVFDAHR
jgi:hypothetical protein